MKFIKRLIGAILIIVIAAAGLVIYSGWEKYKSATEELPLEQAITSIREMEHFTAYEDIAPMLIDAAVSVEDRRFFQHRGVDTLGILRATVYNIKTKSMSEGGSSITQQVAKNIYFMGESTLQRKIAEVFAASDIEKICTKEEILELYFNIIYYGSGYYNIYDASMGYFGKKPSELTDYEATLLAGIPNAPSAYSLNTNPALAEKRQEKVLETMVENGYITENAAEEIKDKNN
ncbi:MAG: biosynthetic peptidoglycan transglycosylase [Clostridia bacterium]|nr:biosynthetic peptidoglycan transglycosylase [Clostridia bacterium]